MEKNIDIVAMDMLVEPVVFISTKKEECVKIPSCIRAEKALPLPKFAQFKDHKYSTRSAYIASFLRKKCGSALFCEFEKE